MKLKKVFKNKDFQSGKLHAARQDHIYYLTNATGICFEWVTYENKKATGLPTGFCMDKDDLDATDWELFEFKDGTMVKIEEKVEKPKEVCECMSVF